MRVWREPLPPAPRPIVSCKEIHYNEMFRFLITTTLSNPHYSPEMSVKVTLLNFAITPEGLQEQMLSIVMHKEQTEMEDQKQQLLKSNADNTRKLKEERLHRP